MSTLNTASRLGVQSCRLGVNTPQSSSMNAASGWVDQYRTVLTILYKEGYIGGFTYHGSEASEVYFEVMMKGGLFGNPLGLVKGPEKGRRPSMTWSDLDVKRTRGWRPLAKHLQRGPEFWILETSKGILSEREAHTHHVGGRILLRIHTLS